MADRNFDDLLGRFDKNIYQSAKGKIRLAMLDSDLRELVPFLQHDHKCTILDAGSGTAEIALLLASHNTQMVLSDISENMLQQAREMFSVQSPDVPVQFIQASIQQLPGKLQQRFDLVLCHAVLEWMEQPRDAIDILYRFIEPGGYLSLMFFNRNSLIMRQMLNGNLKKLKSENFQDKKTTLTPISPLEPETVYYWLEAAGLTIIRKTGIRVMYDYMAGNVRSKRALEDILEMEKRYSGQEPFRSLGRYIHVVCQKPADQSAI
ncbi:MAG: methyltransferase domain-containing protein [Gammaproteobacteria bacterium]